MKISILLSGEFTITILNFKEFTYLELTHGIYNKFFDVEAGDVVFDIGACVGLYPLTILKNNPKKFIALNQTLLCSMRWKKI